MPVINLPTPGATAGPQWATDLNTAINAVNTATDANTTAVATKITSFADPGADRIVFWDDSATAYAPMSATAPLAISGTALTVGAASETVAGVAEVATTAEVTAGTLDTRIVTPLKLAQWLPVGDVQLVIASAGGVTLGSGSFTTVPMDATPTTNIGGGTWNNTTHIYTIPETGLYDCQATIRINDSQAARSFGIGIGTANADGAHFLWGEMGGIFRDAKQYRRLVRFTSGDLVRLYIYSDSVTYPLNSASLSIVKIAN